MTGYTKLDGDPFAQLFKDTEYPTDSVPASTTLTNPYTYEIRNNVIIIHNPIEVVVLNDVLNGIANKLNDQIDLNDFHLVFGLIGTGITEQHIIAMHRPPKTTCAEVYDSKYSDVTQFFLPPRPSLITMLKSGKIREFMNEIQNGFVMLLQSINPFAKSNKTEQLPFESKYVTSVNYHALGTQSYFDGVSCGYHSGYNIKRLVELIAKGENPSPEKLLEATNAPVSSSAALLKDSFPQQANLSFTAFLKKAWQDTFLPLIAEKERHQHHFGHYFMGWPHQDEGSRIAYFITAKFITAPLFNLLTLLVEFPLNLFSEMASFLKNNLISWAPTNGFTQGIRSLLLGTTISVQFAFKGLSYLIRTISSPIISYQVARKEHPALGYLSALSSVILIGGLLAALAVFAPPILAAIAPSMGPGATALLTALATPFTELFAAVGISLSLATAAMLTTICCGLFVGAFHQVGRNVIYPDKSKEVASPKEDSSYLGSNVANLLARSGSQEDDEDNYSVMSAPVADQEDMLGNSLGRRNSKEKSQEVFKEQEDQDTISIHSSSSNL